MTSKFGKSACWLACGPSNIKVGMLLNPLRALLRGHHASDHHTIFFEANRLQRVTVAPCTMEQTVITSSSMDEIPCSMISWIDPFRFRNVAYFVTLPIEK